LRVEPANPPGPDAPTTRWQGTTTGVGFRRIACPAARAAAGFPAIAASSAYRTVVPGAIVWAARRQARVKGGACGSLLVAEVDRLAGEGGADLPAEPRCEPGVLAGVGRGPLAEVDPSGAGEPPRAEDDHEIAVTARDPPEPRRLAPHRFTKATSTTTGWWSEGWSRAESGSLSVVRAICERSSSLKTKAPRRSSPVSLTSR